MFPTVTFQVIQSWWEVPSIAHYCSIFRKIFNLPKFNVQDLEKALLSNEEPVWLQDLIIALLKGCLRFKSVDINNYHQLLYKLFARKCVEYKIANPLETNVNFHLLPIRNKVDVLHELCNFRLEADDVLDQLRYIASEKLRVEPLGYDSNKSAYWYFTGIRIYKEHNPNTRKSVWQVACFTLEDWNKLAEKLQNSRKIIDIELGKKLQDKIPDPRWFNKYEKQCSARLRISSRLKIKNDEEEKYKQLLLEEEDRKRRDQLAVEHKLQQIKLNRRGELCRKRELIAGAETQINNSENKKFLLEVREKNTPVVLLQRLQLVEKESIRVKRNLIERVAHTENYPSENELRQRSSRKHTKESQRHCTRSKEVLDSKRSNHVVEPA